MLRAHLKRLLMNERPVDEWQDGSDDVFDDTGPDDQGDTEHEEMTWTRCGAEVTFIPIAGLGGSAKGVWTGIVGETFTRSHGPGGIYLCEPCAVWLLTHCKYGPDHRVTGDD